MNGPEMIHMKRRIPTDKLMTRSITIYKENGPLLRLKTFPLWKKLWNERKLKKLIDQLLDDIEPYLSDIQEHKDDPENIPASTIDHVKTIILEAMGTVDTNKLLFEQPFLTHFVDRGFMDVAERFIFNARKEDAVLTNNEVFQALRNVFIMNSLQLCWNRPLELTKPMYAYSLLYPYTDNMLDDPSISNDTKKIFNERLAKVIAGETLTSTDPKEQRMFDLVKEIKACYPAEHFPEVTESVQLIHQAQIMSLDQNYKKALDRDIITTITFFKGGTSVLADAYLIKGTLTQDDMLFAFHFGAFLQLLDDLQDKEADKEKNNQTLFSTALKKETTDQEIKRLSRYIFKVNKKKAKDSPSTALMKNVISQCTLLMVMETVGKSPDSVTRRFYKELESYSKVRLSFYKEIEHKMSDILNI